ncbi:MAG: carboxylesterase family protein [Alphaproteobacteria bacterium]|nr:carboxylesterase family protein [Alphaproteobacteria bacterium]
MRIVTETTAGRISGYTAQGVIAFKGIPYAAAPVAPNRFKAPLPVAPWAGVRDAVSFPLQARQILFPFLDPAQADNPSHGASLEFHRGVETKPIPYGEDCLALNVWTPSTGGKRPVMVWLHGGGFAAGSGSWGWWTGEDLARHQDVVVVTLNHRLNIFGFLYLDELGGAAHGLAANAGMRDIVAALEWVRDNIGSFGGDADNITIFGQSGGGMKVAALLAMPAALGLFHKAIVQSGPFLRAVPRARATGAAEQALHRLGIKPGHLEDLQTVSDDAILAAFAAAREGAPGVLRQFAPVIDGATLPADPFEPAATPLAADIPMLIGATSEEVTSLTGFGDPSIFALRADKLPRRVAEACDTDIATATSLIGTYRAGRPKATPAQLYAAIVSDRRFGQGSITQAERQSAHAPVYAYRLTWQSPVQGGRMGAPHNLCLPLVFGRDRAPGVTGDGTAHHALATAMQTAWARFARSGDPNHDGLPEWPPFEPTRRATMILDAECRAVDDPDRSERIAQESLPPRL